jgi:uncharacterized protein YvpB
MKNKPAMTIVIILLFSALAVCAAAVLWPEKGLSGASSFEKKPSSVPFYEKRLSGVPLYEQPTNETCGEAAFLMAWNYTHADKPLNMDKVIGTAAQKGWYVNPDPAHIFTSPDHMQDMAAYYASQNAAPAPEAGHVSDQTQALLFLFSQLTQGHPVIVDVNTDMGNIKSPAHFVVVTGVSFTDTQIYYNDPYGYIAPANHGADQQRADWALFWNSWRNNGDDNGQGNGWYMLVK